MSLSRFLAFCIWLCMAFANKAQYSKKWKNSSTTFLLQILGTALFEKKNLKKNFSATSKNCNFFQILVHCTTSATYSGVFVQLFCIHFINNNIVHFNVRTLSDFVCYVDNFQTAMKIVYYNFWGTVYRIGIIYLFF